MTGLHTVRKSAAGRIDRWYVYAWRGGPCIHIAEGPRPVIGPALLEKARAARLERGGPAASTLDHWIDKYRASPQFTTAASADQVQRPGVLASSTQRDYRLWLDRISSRFGKAPLAAFADPRMRSEIIDWRDQWASQPRTADKGTVMMSTLLGWIVENGHLAVNVAAGIRQLHKVDKSDMIWERRHLRAFANVPDHLRDALKMAGLTGLRLGDLVKLDWSMVGAKAIILTTAKRKVRAVIPITPALRRLLDKRSWRTGPVLRNSRGKGWTDSGLGGVFQKAKPDWFDRTIHDLRGTYATHLIMAGLTDDQVAMIMGWTAKRIAAIRARYVNEERVIIHLAEQISKKVA